MIHLQHRAAPRGAAPSAATGATTRGATHAELAGCAYCGHSRRNHEHGQRECARALCDCGRFTSSGTHTRAA